MSQFLRSRGPVIFAFIGLAAMLAMRILDGNVSGKNAYAFAEISAWCLIIFGFAFARRLDSNFESLIRRLANRGALVADASGVEDLIRNTRRRATAWGHIGSALCPIALVVTYAYYRDFALPVRGESCCIDVFYCAKIVLEIIAVIIGGGYIGQMIHHGSFGRWLRNHQIEITVNPKHPDGAGGLRVVGDFYLYQAGLIMLAVLFFAFWFVVGPAWDKANSAASTSVKAGPGTEIVEAVPPKDTLDAEGKRKRWQNTYGFLFLCTLLIEIAAFVIPLIFFHWEMRRETPRYYEEADRLGNEVTGIRVAALDEADPSKIGSMQSRCKLLEEEIRILENAPTWPVNSGIRKRFAWGNLIVFFSPLLAGQEFVKDMLSDTLKLFLNP